jgi:hypothetical protein
MVLCHCVVAVMSDECAVRLLALVLLGEGCITCKYAHMGSCPTSQLSCHMGRLVGKVRPCTAINLRDKAQAEGGGGGLV